LLVSLTLIIMGKLVKNHWARLIILTAAACKFSLLPSSIPHSQLPDQVLASLEGFFWPKIFWDFLTKTLDGAVKPFPTLQIINLVFGLTGLAYEWPLKFVAGTSLHKSIELRLMLFPLWALAAAILYQGTNAALYYLIGVVVYFWAYSEGEVRFP
jgi:hypothetical protein